jgi:hypothetical protein
MKPAEEELDGDVVHNFFQKRNATLIVYLWEYSRG